MKRNPDEIEVCPKCDDPSLIKNKTDSFNRGGSTFEWRCKNCNHSFDNPKVRERKGHSGVSGLAKRLLETDSSEVGK